MINNAPRAHRLLLASTLLLLGLLFGCGDDSPTDPSGTDVGDVSGDATSAGTIAGRVTLLGNDPLGGSRVIVDGSLQETAANGTYRVDDVAAGTRSVRASRDGYISQEREVVVSAGLTYIADFELIEGSPDNRPPTIGELSASPSTFLDANGVATITASTSSVSSNSR